MRLPVNTTLGELLSDERTAPYGLEFKKHLDTLFGVQNTDDENASSKEAISDAMNNAMVASMPLRNVGANLWVFPV